MMTTTEVVEEILRGVAELPDRTSPDDWPEAMLVTHDELESIVRAALAAPAPAGVEELIEVLRRPVPEQLDSLRHPEGWGGALEQKFARYEALGYNQALDDLAAALRSPTSVGRDG